MATPDQATIIWPPPPIDAIDRQNQTPARNQHPKDHEDLEVAVNAILAVLGHNPHGDDGNLTVRLHLMQTILAQTSGDLNTLLDGGLQELVLETYQQLQAADHYVHQQPGSADTWHVPHALGYDPIVEVIRADGVRVVGYDLTYAPDQMSLTLGFSQAISGRALLAN